MNKIKISVIIPVYNDEKYLEKCLNSVVNQTFKDIEIICVNDGSTDDSLKILKKFSEKNKNILIINKENEGLGAARNTGMEYATGEYISFIDSDDWVNENMYSYLYPIASSKKLDVLFFQMINFINNTGEFQQTRYYNLTVIDKKFDGKIFTHHDIADVLFNISISACTKIYKKEFLEKNDIKFIEGYILEDNPFFFDIILNADRISIFRKHLYYRRIRENSIMTSKGRECLDSITISNEILRTFEKNNKIEKYKTELFNFKFNVMRNWYDRTNDIYKKEFYNLIKTDLMEISKNEQLNKYYLNNLNINHLYFYLNITNTNGNNKSLNNENLSDKIIGDKKLNDEKNKINKSNFNEENMLIDKSRKIKENLKIEDKNHLNSPKNKEKPAISVIVPVYNNEDYLEECLDSILNQTLKNIEIICINDGSTDNSLQILENYAEKDIRIKLYNQSNQGAGIARNKGIDNSIGKYLCFIDSDDFIIDKNSLEVMFKIANEKNLNMVSGNLRNFSNNKFQKNNNYPEIFHEKRICPQDYGIPWYYVRNIFKRELINEKNIRFPKYQRGQDPVFLAKILSNISSLFIIPVDFYAYRYILEGETKIKNNAAEISYIKHFINVLNILNSDKFLDNNLKYLKKLGIFLIKQKRILGEKMVQNDLKKATANDPLFLMIVLKQEDILRNKNKNKDRNLNELKKLLKIYSSPDKTVINNFLKNFSNMDKLVPIEQKETEFDKNNKVKLKITKILKKIKN